MARGYGIANFGDGNYGVTTYVDATASGSVVATTSVIGGKVYYGSAAFSASSDGSAVGVFVIEGSSQDVTAVSTTASAAVEVFDGLASMGGSAVGSTASGTKVIQGSATVVAGVTLAEASLQFITNGKRQRLLCRVPLPIVRGWRLGTLLLYLIWFLMQVPTLQHLVVWGLSQRHLFQLTTLDSEALLYSRFRRFPLCRLLVVEKNGSLTLLRQKRGHQFQQQAKRGLNLPHRVKHGFN